MPDRAARRLIAALLALPAVAALAAGCSNSEAAVNKRPHDGSGTASAVHGVQQVTLTSGADLRFHPSTIVVHRGEVRLVLVNTAQPNAGPPHNLQVSVLPAANVPLTYAGRRTTVRFMAPSPGRYHFVCTIHEAQGQTGTMIVRAGS